MFKRWKCFTPDGGKVVLSQILGESGVSGGCSGLSQAEFQAYELAKLTADARNGGDWDQAVSILKAAGFRCYRA